MSNATISGKRVGVEFEMVINNIRGDFFVYMFKVFKSKFDS